MYEWFKIIGALLTILSCFSACGPKKNSGTQTTNPGNADSNGVYANCTTPANENTGEICNDYLNPANSSDESLCRSIGGVFKSGAGCERSKYEKGCLEKSQVTIDGKTTDQIMIHWVLKNSNLYCSGEWKRPDEKITSPSASPTADTTAKTTPVKSDTPTPVLTKKREIMGEELDGPAPTAAYVGFPYLYRFLIRTYIETDTITCGADNMPKWMTVKNNASNPKLCELVASNITKEDIGVVSNIIVTVETKNVIWEYPAFKVEVKNWNQYSFCYGTITSTLHSSVKDELFCSAVSNRNAMLSQCLAWSAVQEGLQRTSIQLFTNEKLETVQAKCREICSNKPAACEAVGLQSFL